MTETKMDRQRKTERGVGERKIVLVYGAKAKKTS